jgi:hypothetical protein
MIKKKYIITLCCIFTLLTQAQTKLENAVQPSVVNLFNVIRRTTNKNGAFNQWDYQTIEKQINLYKQHGFVGTYALTYDALTDSTIVKFLKKNLNSKDELAIWWEINEDLAQKAHVKWKGKHKISLHVDEGYSVAYNPKERLRLVDAYMDTFKTVFNHYPSSIAAWVLDAVTLEYANKKYRLEAAAICRDQLGVDGFSLWGGYTDQAYYPSKKNIFIPAQQSKSQIKVPIFRLLGSDPIYNWEVNLRPRVEGCKTLEPVWETGKSPQWVNYYFESKNDMPKLGFSYTQMGQENTFLWLNMQEGLEMQMNKLEALVRKGKVRLETMRETGKWFKQRYKLTPSATVTATKDWHPEYDLKTYWYSSRFYSISWLFEKKELSIREFFLFDENYTSRYFQQCLKGETAIFDALPLVFSHEKKCQNRPFLRLENHKGKALQCTPPIIKTIGNNIYSLSTQLNKGGKITCTMKQNSLEIKSSSAHQDWQLSWTAFPYCIEHSAKKIRCKHHHFEYEINLIQGKVVTHQERIVLVPEKGKLQLDLNTANHEVMKDDFLTTKYLENPTLVDPQKITSLVVGKDKSVAFAPTVSSTRKVAYIGDSIKIIIKKQQKEDEIRYTLDGSTPNETSLIYHRPLALKQTTQICVKSFRKGKLPSRVVKYSVYFTYPLKIKTKTQPNSHYSRNGVQDLVDLEKGTINYAQGKWLGYQDNVDVILDLGKSRPLQQLTLTCLQNSRQWIFYPKRVFVYGSNNYDREVLIKDISLKNEGNLSEIGLYNFKIDLKKQAYRYLHVIAITQGPCPKWSPCYLDGEGWLFIDEITVE